MVAVATALSFATTTARATGGFAMRWNRCFGEGGWQDASPILGYLPASGPPRNAPGQRSIGTCVSATPTTNPT